MIFADRCSKSQGQTLDRVLVDGRVPMFEHGMTYVAASRVHERLEFGAFIDNSCSIKIWDAALQQKRDCLILQAITYEALLKPLHDMRKRANTHYHAPPPVQYAYVAPASNTVVPDVQANSSTTVGQSSLQEDSSGDEWDWQVEITPDTVEEKLNRLFDFAQDTVAFEDLLTALNAPPSNDEIDSHVEHILTGMEAANKIMYRKGDDSPDGARQIHLI
jgi:hypothetical protein